MKHPIFLLCGIVLFLYVVVRFYSEPRGPVSQMTGPSKRGVPAPTTYPVDALHLFRANSVNDGENKQLWVQGAGLFIPLLNELLEFSNRSKPTIKSCDAFFTNDALTLNLGKLFNQHGSDKATAHDYFKLYGHILQELGVKNHLALLEIGMGTNKAGLVSTMGAGGRPGASLRAFRDFLPNAKIFGADIDRDILFTEDRITTRQVDQLDRKSFQPLTIEQEMFDIIIDDGLHSTPANMNTMIWAMKHIKPGGYIVIEDISSDLVSNWDVVSFIISHTAMWRSQLLHCQGGSVFILHRLKG